MRGAQELDRLKLSPEGIIPADAGSTPGSMQSYRTLRDHPRGCGEHDPNDIEVNDTKGSSPRMRGARNVGVVGPRPGGIIPADAGST